MNCAEFWDQMPELGSGDHADYGHTKECSQCAALLEKQRRLASGLRHVAGDMRGVMAPPRVEANLLEAFRREAVPAGARSVHVLRMRWMPAVSWAAAIAAVIAMGVWIAPRRHAASPVTHHSAGSAVELATLTDDATDDDGFIPLPNAERVGPNDDVNVVQMELTRSAMLVVGLEVSPDRVSEPVEAEVMLGPDGLARAVRFLDNDGTY